MEMLLSRNDVHVVSFSVGMYRMAVAAFDLYGKGRGHPARLNFGDCMAYAVAKHHDIPLLFKGEDFARTDIVPAVR
jgi:ribonuclease VapC